jgi:hypothetical protein
MRRKIEWSIKVPIFRNPVILRQLALAVGIPFGLIFVIMLASGATLTDLRYPAILVGLLFFLTWLFIRIVWGGKYDAEFVIDDKGIRCRTAARQARQNRRFGSASLPRRGLDADSRTQNRTAPPAHALTGRFCFAAL